MKWYWIITLIMLIGLLIWYHNRQLHRDMIQKLWDNIYRNMESMSENYEDITLEDIFDNIYVIALSKRRKYILESLKLQ